MADAIVAALDLSDLEDVAGIEPDLKGIYLDASVATLQGIEVNSNSFFNQLNTRAIAFAQQRAAELVSEITETTRDKLRVLVSDGMVLKQNRDEIADAIMSSTGFDDARAYLIADTEIGIANGEGALAGLDEAQKIGVKVKKQWLLGENACDICRDNADQGPIDVDEEFESGDDASPAHPNCVCTIIGVVDETE